MSSIGNLPIKDNLNFVNDNIHNNDNNVIFNIANSCLTYCNLENKFNAPTPVL